MTEWCKRCEQHLVDDRHGLCPSCADDVNREIEEQRRAAGWV